MRETDVREAVDTLSLFPSLPHNLSEAEGEATPSLGAEGAALFPS